MVNKSKETTEKVVDKTEETTEKVAKGTEKATEKMVTIKIPLERGKPNKDVYVSVNDRDWQIKRGIEVEVPKCVAEALRESEAQLLKAYAYQEAMASE